MSTLNPGANSALPAGSVARLQLRTERAHADLIVLAVRADGTADGDDGVALWSQPRCAGGAVVIDPGTDSVTAQLGRLPGEVVRLLIVAQADGVPDLAAAGALIANVSMDGGPPVALSVPQPPPLPTVQLAELYRHSAGWKVRCLGDGYADGLQRLLEVHGIEVTDGGDASASPSPPAPPGPPAHQGSPTWAATPPAPAAPPPAPSWHAPPAPSPAWQAPPPQPPQPAPPQPAPASPIDLEKRRQVDILKKVQATGSVSLTKKVEAAAISMAKQGLVGQRAQVVLVLDVSGSAQPLFKDGRYQVLIERALAAGLLFDDDGTIQAYLFDTTLHEAPDITLHNVQSWAQGVRSMRGIWGGTMYAPPIERIARDVGRGRPVPTYVMFITDGGNFDRRETAKAMKTASSMSVFWQFMAVGREEQFPFLRRLDDLKGREIDNADFFAFENPVAVPDEVFFGKMMQEFPGWIAAARQRGILQ